MVQVDKDRLDVRIRQALTTWKKIDETDIAILEGLSMIGPRNLALIAKQLGLPASTIRFRVRRMISDSILFLHLNPYHTNMGLKKVVLFIEAVPGFEDLLLKCLKIVDFWIQLFRIYRPYEGCGGVWTIPKENVEDFSSFLKSLQDRGIAKSIEAHWSTCFQGIPVRKRWYSEGEGSWGFNWDEWANELETIQGELPYTLVEPEDWPIKADYIDLLIIKELEIDGRTTLNYISKKLNQPLPKIKYHFYNHVLKQGLVEDYQVEIYRFPFPVCELLFFKFDFEEYDKLVKFALSLLDKPFAIFMGKVLGENSLISQIYMPKWEFRKFIHTLSSLIRRGFMKKYRYFIEDMYQTWRETIPYQHFKDGRWNYDNNKHHEELNNILEKMS